MNIYQNVYLLPNFVLQNNVLCGPKVKVNEGVLEGRKSSTENGFEYHSFQGIPYAKPPINELRFKVIKSDINIYASYKILKY